MNGPKFKIGDIVEIVDKGCSYSSTKFRNDQFSILLEGYKNQKLLNSSIFRTNNISNGLIGIIKDIDPRKRLNHTAYLVEINSKNACVIGEDGLIKLSVQNIFIGL